MQSVSPAPHAAVRVAFSGRRRVGLLPFVLRRLADLFPRRKRVLNPVQCRREFREVSPEHVAHRVVLDPRQPLLCVHGLVPPASRDEAVALEPPARHQDEHSECRVTEPEPLRQWLAQAPHQQVDRLDPVGPVHGFELAGERLVPAREFHVRLGRRHVEEPSEGVVAWDAALPVTGDVDSPHVARVAVGGVLKLAKERRHVVVGDGARIVDAEGEEGVGEGDAVVEGVLGFGEGEVYHGDGGFVFARGEREKGNVVWLGMSMGRIFWPARRGRGVGHTWDQTVQSVDRDKLFGDGIRDAVLVDS